MIYWTLTLNLRQNSVFESNPIPCYPFLETVSTTLKIFTNRINVLSYNDVGFTMAYWKKSLKTGGSSVVERSGPRFESRRRRYLDPFLDRTFGRHLAGRPISTHFLGRHRLTTHIDGNGRVVFGISKGNGDRWQKTDSTGKNRVIQSLAMQKIYNTCIENE